MLHIVPHYTSLLPVNTHPESRSPEEQGLEETDLRNWTQQGTGGQQQSFSVEIRTKAVPCHGAHKHYVDGKSNAQLGRGSNIKIELLEHV